MLTNDVVNFKQPAPGQYHYNFLVYSYVYIYHSLETKVDRMANVSQ